MKAFNVTSFFLLIICICVQIRSGEGLFNKCKKWNNWTECNNNYIVRYCMSDTSLQKKKNCENCGKWTQWSMCKDGKQQRHLTNCPHIVDINECKDDGKTYEEGEDIHESNAELTGAVLDRNITKSSYIMKNSKSKNQKDMNTHNFDSYGTKVVTRGDLNDHDNIHNEGENRDTNVNSFINTLEHGEGPSRNLQNAAWQKEEEDKKKGERANFMSDNPKNAGAFLNAPNENNGQKDKTLRSNANISEHKILEAENKFIPFSSLSNISNEGEIETSELESRSDLELKSDLEKAEGKKDPITSASASPSLSRTNSSSKEGVFSETSEFETDANQDTTKNSSKEHNKRGFGGSFTKTNIASGIAASIVLGGGVVAYIYARGKGETAELESENKNENYEVIFNDDDKTDSAKNLYEEEFWSYE